jgi:sucrose phosphorylase
MPMVKSAKFHLLEPDYGRKTYIIPEETKIRLLEKLKTIYGAKEAELQIPELERIMKVYYAHKSIEMIEWEKSFHPEERFSEQDVILITYGDIIRDDGQHPLHTLAELCRKYLKGVFNTLHLLPFFPSSSDRGFSVKDFTEVDPALGSWEDIAALKNDFNLMFDGVFNHVSSKSKWFHEFLNQNPVFVNFFTVFSTTDKIPPDYLSLLVRPRTTDVLTPFDTLSGKKYVWTTFSQDQIDLNFSNPKVLIKVIEILLFYVAKGADIIRLDAVTYLWDELGTSGVHLSQTHTIIKLFRDVLNAVAPHVALITETNVPHEENVKYFGDGVDEAQMVYNFALPPLVLHTFQTGNSKKLTSWAKSLPKVSDTATYFNFLDSHDGVGVMAVKNILSREEIERMALKVIENGGFISYKTESDGSKSPYELNITWYSAINSPDDKESDEIQVKRYLASRAIALVLMGVPGIYLHGLLGSKNDAEAVIEDEETRSIN